jgi:hypothetical protein
MFVIYLLFIAFLLIVGRVALVYLSPERDCRWCDGKGRRLSLILHRKRKCWRCKGDGHVWRLGARTVRKARMAAVDAYREWRYDR